MGPAPPNDTLTLGTIAMSTDSIQTTRATIHAIQGDRHLSELSPDMQSAVLALTKQLAAPEQAESDQRDLFLKTFPYGY